MQQATERTKYCTNSVLLTERKKEWKKERKNIKGEKELLAIKSIWKRKEGGVVWLVNSAQAASGYLLFQFGT